MDAQSSVSLTNAPEGTTCSVPLQQKLTRSFLSLPVTSLLEHLVVSFLEHRTQVNLSITFGRTETTCGGSRRLCDARCLDKAQQISGEEMMFRMAFFVAVMTAESKRTKEADAEVRILKACCTLSFTS